MIITSGKNIIFGEHAMVYPTNTGIIAANNLTCKVEVKKNNTTSTIGLTASGTFKLKKNYDLAALSEYLKTVRETYDRFKETQDIALMKNIIKQEDDLMKLSIAVALDYLEGKVKRIEGFDLYVLSEVPVQSGFGSSAVFSSAVIAAILSGYGFPLDKDLIFDLTMEIERFQHLNPSGEGPATVIYGNLIKLNKNKSGNPTIEQLTIKNLQLKMLMKGLMIVHSGMPDQTTGELINYVRQQIEKDESKKQVLENIEANTQRFLALNEKETCEESEFVELINNNGRLLEELGLVTEKAKSFMESIRIKGGGAKFTGAGGQTGGSGALLVYHNDREFIKNLAKEFEFEFFDIEFGEGGLTHHL